MDDVFRTRFVVLMRKDYTLMRMSEFVCVFNVHRTVCGTSIHFYSNADTNTQSIYSGNTVQFTQKHICRMCAVRYTNVETERERDREKRRVRIECVYELVQTHTHIHVAMSVVTCECCDVCAK